MHLNIFTLHSRETVISQSSRFQASMKACWRIIMTAMKSLIYGNYKFHQNKVEQGLLVS